MICGFLRWVIWRIWWRGRWCCWGSGCGCSASWIVGWRRSCEPGDRDRGQGCRQEVPAVLRAEPVAEGVVHAATPGQVRRVLGVAEHLVRGADWFRVCAHRGERVGEEHVVEVHCS